MPAMQTADAAWLRMDSPTNPMVINAVAWFEGPIELDALHTLLAERLVERFPRYRQRAIAGGLSGGGRWEDDERFDLDLHIHHAALPAPGDTATLREVVDDLVAMPLSRERPLWAVHVLDGYRGGSVLVFRMHHAIADGIALARVMLSLMEGPDGRPLEQERFAGRPGGRLPLVPDAVEHAAGTAGRAAGAVAHEAVETLLHPRHVASLARTAVQDARIVAKFAANPPDRPTALHGELGAGHRVGWTEPMALDHVRDLAHAFGVTINDVLIAALTGVVGEHLGARGKVPDEVHAMVPFNLRPLDAPLPRDLGNRFGLLLLGLPVGLRTPIERLQEVQRRTRAIKESHEGAISYGILEGMGATPAAVEARLVDLFSAKATMVVTNVPGPREALSLTGVPLGGVLVWAPCSGHVGMSVSIFSYRGQVTVGFLVNRALEASPQALADALPEQLGRLQDLTASPRGRAAR